MIFEKIVFIDGLVTTSTLFAVVTGFVFFLLGIEVNTFGLILLGNLLYLTIWRAFSLKEKIHEIVEPKYF